MSTAKSTQGHNYHQLVKSADLQEKQVIKIYHVNKRILKKWSITKKIHVCKTTIRPNEIWANSTEEDNEKDDENGIIYEWWARNCTGWRKYDQAHQQSNSKMLGHGMGEWNCR